MKQTHSTSTFSCIPMAARDPILGVTEAFNTDINPLKTNLGVGVYYDDFGTVPVLECVRRAERLLMEQMAPRSYLPIEGLGAYQQAVLELVFGADSAVISDKRAVALQTLGGTGALKIGADFLKRFARDSEVYISDPSWENHRALFESAGFSVKTYPYYHPETHGIDFDGMLAAFKAMPERSIVLLHACCHNPTGADLDAVQWGQVIQLVSERGLIPFLDMAYQGFDVGIDEDGAVVRRFVEAGGPVFVANSFSKSFSLYGERVGALSVVGTSADEAACVLSQLKRVVRTNYSSPPTHAGKVVATILSSPELRRQWEYELASMRVRIKRMRGEMVEKLSVKVPGRDFSFIRQQAGMFSYSGLSKEQVGRLREDSIYAVDTGRICVAALNSTNIDRVVDAIAKVLQAEAPGLPISATQAKDRL